MTKKDYVAIAAAIRHQMNCWTLTECPDALKGIAGAADEMAYVFAADNPRFDRAKFLSACGIDQA